MNKTDRYDIIISGASHSGLVLARAMSEALGARARIAIIDIAPAGAAGNNGDNPRAFALSRSSKQMLDVLGAWSLVADNAQPITDIEITDSSLDAGVRPVVLRYENILDDGGPASYVVPDAALVTALRQVVRQSPNVEILSGTSMATITQETGFAHIRLDDDRDLTTKLIAVAEGRSSKTRDQAGIKVVASDYAQSGIVTVISHEKPHNGTAVQHFLPAGPFAILPMTGNRSCITWTEDRDRARELMAADDQTFLAEVDRRVGGRMGGIELEGPRRSWPLSIHMARSFIAQRLALIGDTAHGVHPIAGQGLNLGLRDVAALTEVIADAWRLGLDIGANSGSGDALARYERWRRFDSTMSAAAFDGLNRLFSNDWALLRSARMAGLGIVDRITPLKRAFVTEAAGLSGNVPRLLQGEAV